MTQVSHKIFAVSLYLVVITILLPRSASNFAIALLILSWLGSAGWQYNNTANFLKRPTSMVSILLLLTYSISFFWTEDLIEGIKNLEVLAPLLIFPVVMAMAKKVEISLENILKVFVYAVISILLINFVIAIFRTLDYGFFFKDPQHTVIYNNFLYHGFASGTGIHPSFLTLFACFSIMILLNPESMQLGFSRNSKIMMVIILAAGIILLQAITVTFATIAALSVIFLFKMKKPNIKYSIYLSLVLLLVIVFSYILFIKLDWTRNIVSYNLESYTGWNSVNLRLALWEAAGKAISQNVPWGVGIGDAQHVLLEKFHEMNFHFAAINNYQPHNQFLYSWLMAGLPCVLATILLFVTMVRSAIRKQNHLYLGLVIVFIIFCLTDIPLSRNKPLVFLIFFTYLFEFLDSKGKETGIRASNQKFAK